MQLNLNHLAIFHAVSQEQSISRGADRLMVSQPAVSKQLRVFERAVGAALFDRTPRGVRLTEAGELLAGYAQRIFALEAEARAALENLRGLRRGRLAIGASTTIGVYLLPELCVKFRRQFPAIDLSLEISTSNSVVQKVAEGLLELGFVETSVKNAACEAERFMSDELVAIAVPGHVLLRKKRVAASDFCHQTFISRASGSDTKSFVEKELLARGLAIQPALSLPSTEAIKRAVAAGMGVAIVSRLSIAMELKLKTLAVVRVAGLAIRRPFYRIVRRGASLSRASEAFLKCIQAR